MFFRHPLWQKAKKKKFAEQHFIKEEFVKLPIRINKKIYKWECLNNLMNIVDIFNLQNNFLKCTV